MVVEAVLVLHLPDQSKDVEDALDTVAIMS